MIAVLDGTISIGPQQVTEESFPAGTLSEPLSFNPFEKQVQVSTGTLQRTLNSSGSFVALSGIGATDTVVQGLFLYVRCKGGSMQLRLTMKDPGGGADIVSVLPFDGTSLHEFQANGWLKGLEAKGSGTIAYLIGGNP